MKRVLIGAMLCLLLAGRVEVQAEEYLYDELNRVTKVIYEDGSFVEYEYDKNGNIIDVNVYEAESSETGPGTEVPGDSEEGDDSGSSEESGESGDSEESTESSDSDDSDNQEPPSEEDTSDESTSILDSLIEGVTNVINRIVKWFQSIFSRW